MTDRPALRLAAAFACCAAVSGLPACTDDKPSASAADRLRTSSPSPEQPAESPTVTGQAPAGPESKQVTVIRVVGDLMLGRRVGERLEAANDFRLPLRPTARRLASADVTIGNLESTLSQAGAPRQGGDSFAADPRVLAGLRMAGFDVLSLANNHVGDFGPTALVRTVRHVRAAGIEPVGAGANDQQARSAVVLTRDGIRVGVVAFDAIGESPRARAGVPGVARLRMQPRTGALSKPDLDRVIHTVRALDKRADVVLVMPHWGAQYTSRTVTDQRRVGRMLVRAGADVVAGSHPHWAQGVERHRGGLIAYSLGNYVFDMDFARETRQGLILELTFWDGRLHGFDLVPVWIGRDYSPRPAVGTQRRAILQRVAAASGPPLAGTAVTGSR